MNKFQSLINKTIVLKECDTIVSKFAIVRIEETNENSSCDGVIYACRMQYYFNPPPPPHEDWLIGDKTLTELLEKGIVYHHAHLSQSMSIENPN